MNTHTNRRGFFKTLAVAAAGFTILPAATTYERIWRVQRKVVPVKYVLNPAWVNAPYELVITSYHFDFPAHTAVVRSDKNRVPIRKYIKQSFQCA